MRLIYNPSENFCLINTFKYMINQNMKDCNFKEAEENLKELRKLIKKYEACDFVEETFIRKAAGFYYSNMSTVELEKGNIKMAMKNIKHANRCYTSKQDQSFIQWSNARLYEEIYNFTKALKIYYELLEYYTQTEQKEREIDIKHNIGYILKDIPMLEECLEDYSKLNKINKIDNCLDSISEIRSNQTAKAG